MIDKLCIQCPACGSYLEVKNSKNEAVKHILCPRCKKQLAIDFKEKETVTNKPLEAIYYGELRIDMHEGINQIPLPKCESVEIKVVRLSDGNSKCLVSAKSPQHSLYVNNILLNFGDQIALAIGDELRIGNTVLTFGAPGTQITIPHSSLSNVSNSTATKSDSIQEPVTHSNFKWLLMASVIVIAIVGVWAFINSSKKTTDVVNTIVVDPKDSVAELHQEAGLPATLPSKVKSKPSRYDENKVVEVKHKSENEPLSDFQLELKAQKGDVEAQFELGNRLVRKSGKNNILMGLNYLNLAARNGSVKASRVYNSAISSIKQRAEGGDQVANDILISLE